MFFISQAFFYSPDSFLSGKDNMPKSGFPYFLCAVPWFSVLVPRFPFLFPSFSGDSLIHVLEKATGIPPDGHH